MNRTRKTCIVSVISALGLCCCLGPPAQAQQTEAQTQSFTIPSLGSPPSTLTFSKFDGTVPCRILQEVSLSCDWIVNFDFIFTNDSDFSCSGTFALEHEELLVIPAPPPPGGGIECSSGGAEVAVIGPNLPPGETQFFLGLVSLTHAERFSLTTNLEPFIGGPGETVDAVLSSALSMLLLVPCAENTNATDSLWEGMVTLEYVFVEPGCPGDTNGDDVIDVNDLNNVILDWGTDGSANCGDITGPVPGSPPDGVVNVDDLNAVIVGWGACP